MPLAILSFLMLCCSFSFVQAENSFPRGANLIAVDDPYIDLYTQPGRGYPVFHVVERGETIMVVKRRPNWFAIRTEQGIEGWTPESQLAKTLQPTGMPVQLPGMNRGQFLKRSFRIGFGSGLFNGQQLTGLAQTISLNAGYKLLRAVDVEAEAGQLFASSSYGYMAGAGMLFEPISRGGFTPFVSYGGGYLTLATRKKLVSVEGLDQSYQKLGLGVNLYIGINFVARAEYQQYFFSDDNLSGVNEWKLGFNTFF